MKVLIPELMAALDITDIPVKITCTTMAIM
jgi:hypothetical protein